jgi:anti-sigma factor ChrR (cupin superfamily)
LNFQFAPGAAVPDHWHRGWEHVICLEGTFEDDRGVFEKGDVVYNPPGSHHRGLHSKTGCIVLMQWEESVGFMEKKPEGKQ